MVQISLILPYFLHYFRKFLLLKKQHIITDEMALPAFSLEQSRFRPVNILAILCGVLSRAVRLMCFRWYKQLLSYRIFHSNCWMLFVYCFLSF